MTNKKHIQIYSCEFCNFETDAKGLYMQHIWKKHHRYFNEICLRNTTPKTMIQLLKYEITQDYETEINAANECKIVYRDAYDKEIIYIKRVFNEYGVANYTLWIDQIDLDQEIESASALAQHDEYGDEFNDMTEQQQEKAIEKIENDAEIAIKEWNNKPTIETRIIFKDTIRLNTFIHTETCFLNMTHTHTFKGKQLRLYTNDLKTLKAVIDARNVIFALYNP